MQAPRANLADGVTNRDVAALIEELRLALPRLHRGVRVVESPVELRAEFRGVTLCRVVPYRELLHVQVGEDPLWETRLRSAREFPGVMDRILRVFLRTLAASPDDVPPAV